MQRDVLIRLPILATVAAACLCAGCAIDCDDAAEKLVQECDLLWELDLLEEDFQRQCEQMEEHYEDDEAAAVAFQEHLECLMTTECSSLELDPTTCDDGEIYIFM